MLKAIETVYKGYRFRSRLEARWAVFFDALGIEWEYEKEGYDLNGVWYLPDFWMPGSTSEAETFGAVDEDTTDPGYWVEIKANEPTPEEDEKAARLAIESGKPVLMLIGEPWMGDAHHYARAYSRFARDGRRSGWSVWTECPHCHAIAICPQGERLFLPCSCPGTIEGAYNDETGEDTRRCTVSTSGPRLESAFTSARKARFEHGEKP